jgi:hypothetical protein
MLLNKMKKPSNIDEMFPNIGNTWLGIVEKLHISFNN